MSTLQIHVLPALTDNFIYALTDSNGHCAVIDPGEAKPVLEFLDKEKDKMLVVLSLPR